MPATAAARRTPPRARHAQPRLVRAGRPARRTPVRVHRQPGAGQLIPLAVGRTAVAVRGLPDTGLVVRMTRGQAWIGVLGVLLVGIVALNVLSLSLGATSGRITQQIEGIQQQNSTLEASLASRLSDQRIQAAATRLGLIVPDAGNIRYLTANSRYAAIAGGRLAGGDFTIGSTIATTFASTSAGSTTAMAAPTATTVSPTTSSAPVSTPVQPATGTAAPIQPAPTPAAPSPSSSPAAGGVSSP